MLAGLERWLETPMLILSFVWLLLVIVELTWSSTPLLGFMSTAIWIAFLAEFALRLALAPDKLRFARHNWLTMIALAAPALRLLSVLRVLRLASAARGLRLLTVIGTANRGMNALRASLGRRGLGYVMALTVLVTVLGAGGMYTFEHRSEVAGGFGSYWDALWWTAMLITTIGSQFWPHTLEGRILCFLLSLYGLAVFGYITASLASFFVGRDAAAHSGSELSDELSALKNEIGALRRDLRIEPAGTGDEG